QGSSDLQGPSIARSRTSALLSEVLAEDDARTRGPCVIFDFASNPALRFVEGDRTLVADVRDGLEPPTTGSTRLFLERLVEHLTDTATTVVRMNAHEVHV